MRKGWLSIAAAMLTMPIAGAASAASCTTGSVASFTTVGFSCNVGNVLFSNIGVNAIANGIEASVILGNFTPFSVGNEFGLSLNFSAFTGTAPGGTTDLAWTFNASALPGFLLSDVFMSLSGNASGTGGIVANETLSNGVSLSLNGPGTTTANFTPIALLGVIKDQFNFSGPAGFATTSILQNAFSVSPVPLPGALALMGSALAGGAVIMRRRRKQVAVPA